MFRTPKDLFLALTLQGNDYHLLRFAKNEKELSISMRQNSSETSCLSLALRKVLVKGWKKQSRNVITVSKHHKVAVF